MTDYEKGPGTNWLAPLAGGVALLFVGVMLLGSNVPTVGLLVGIAGIAFVIYDFVKRDRVVRR